MHKKVAVFPGTFDPVTLGHLDIIRRATAIFDEVIVAISRNIIKKTMFDLDQRLHMTKKCITDLSVVIETFDGLLVDFLDRKGVNTVIRGVRCSHDCDRELRLWYTNTRLRDGIETIFMPSSYLYQHISSSFVKEIALLHGDVGSFVPPNVAYELRDYVSKRTEL